MIGDRPVRRWLRNNAEVLTMVLAATAFVMASVGYWISKNAEAPTRVVALLDAAYKGVAAFGAGGEANVASGVYQVGRFLALGIAMWAIAVLLLTRLTTLKDRVRTRFYKNHAIVCGLGEYGLRAALALNREEGLRVVCIEPNTDSPYVKQARNAGLPVIVGDATDTDVLERACVANAQLLMAFTGSDVRNSAIAQAASRALDHRLGLPLECHIHISNLPLWSVMQETSLRSAQSGGLTLNVINDEVITAREVERALAAKGIAPGGGAYELLLVGADGLIEALIVDVCELQRTSGDDACVIHIVDGQAASFIEQLLYRHGDLAQVATLTSYDVEIVGGDYAWINKFLAECGRVRAVVVSQPSEATTIASALTFASAIGASTPVVACTVGESELLKSLRMILGGDIHRPSMVTVDRLGAVAQPRNLRGGLLDDLAQAVHENYLRRERLRPDGPETPSSFVPWNGLGEELQRQNRGQVAEMLPRLAEYGMRIVPSAIAHDPPARFTPGQIEQLAQREHDRWRKAKLEAGWKPGPHTDRDRRIHRDLIPYEDLPEDVKRKDRGAITDIPEIMALAGFRVVRTTA